MAHTKITVHLMGGLGNQMFQYAAGRAIAQRNSAQLHLDTTSGFVNDKVFKRTFSLGVFGIKAKKANYLKQTPFWFERLHDKLRPPLAPIQERPWGTLLNDAQPRFLAEVGKVTLSRNAWMRGYWQSEQYFNEVSDEIAGELAPPAPVEQSFLSMADTIQACNSVAVGVRLFEEVPGANKEGVGGVTPMAFYEEAAARLAETVADPVFFVFCTTQAPALEKLKFPGKVFYITHDNGFTGEIQRLWLISRCKHHILSNSSFYWWAAWLAEKQRPGTRVIASPLFPNRDTVPQRWLPTAA